jgi:hypothetical protein
MDQSYDASIEKGARVFRSTQGAPEETHGVVVCIEHQRAGVACYRAGDAGSTDAEYERNISLSFWLLKTSFCSLPHDVTW